MRTSARRIVAISAVALAVLVAAALLILHLPFARARVLSFAARELAARYDLDLRAARLDYSVFTRNVSLSDVRLAAVGHEDEPFLTAGRVTVALPWSVFRGILAYDRIELDQARVAMLRRADGSSNLPRFDSPADTVRPPLRLDIRGLVLRGLDFKYVDEVRKLAIDAGDLHADLGHRLVQLNAVAEGALEIRRGVQIQIGERRIEAQPITGRMGFDGSALSLDGVGLAMREGTIAVNGTIQRVIDQPALQLRFDGSADLARAADWGTLPIVIGGTTAIRGTIEGPAAAPTIKVEATSDSARLGALEGAGLDAAVTVTTSSVVVDRAVVRAPSTGLGASGSGTLEATANIELGNEGATQVSANWRDLSATTMLRVLDRAGAVAGTPKGVPSNVEGVPSNAKRVPSEEAKAGPANARSVRDIRVASSLTGKMSMTRRPGAPMELTVENRSIGPGTPPRDMVPLTGTLSLGVRNGRWTLKQTHALGTLNVDGTVGGQVSADELTSSTIEGAVVVEATDVAAASSAIEHLGLDLPAIASDLRGPLRATANLSGRLNALQTQASVSSDALVVPGLAPAAVQADLTVTPDRIDVPALTATIGRGTISGNAAIDLRGRTLGGQFTVDAPDVSEVLATLPESARLTGPITATATLGGSTSAPDVRAEVNGQNLTFAGQPIDALEATTHVTADTVFVDAFSLTTREGTLGGTASYAWEKEAYTANLKGANLAWRGQLGGQSETEVRISQLAFTGSGTVPRPGGEGQIAFTLAGGPAGEIVESGTADIRLDGTNAIIEARVPSLGADVRSTILTSAPYTYDATASIAHMDLAPLAGIAGLPRDGVLGRVSLSVTAHGEASRAEESTEVTGNLQQIAATVGEVPVWLTSPATFTWRKDDLRVAPLELGFGTGSLKAGGRLAPGDGAQWNAVFDGELGELIRAARGVTNVPPELSAAGRVAGTWQSTGGLDRSTATVALTDGQMNWAQLPPITALALQAGFDGTTITLSSLTGTWQDGGISGTASVPRAVFDGSARSSGSGARGHVQVKATGLTQKAITPWVSPAVLARIVGRVSATFDADILGTDVKDIAGSLVLDEAQLNLADIDVQQARQTKIGIRDGRITMDDVSWTAGGGPLALTGAVTLDGPTGAALDLALKGDLNLGLLVAFAPTTWTAGSAIVDVTVGGVASDPDVQGRIELQNGEAAVFNPRLILYDLNGTIAVDRRAVRFGGINGSLNGGSIQLDGQLGYNADAARTGQLIIVLGQVALEYPRGLLSETNALLTFQPRGDEWQLGGDVRIARSSYRENISLPALAAANRTRPPVAIDEEATFLDRLRLNVFVTTEEDLAVDNNYGRIQAGAAVRVIGTASEPALNGRVTLREGSEVFLAGRTFRVERGAISFTRPTRIEPEFDIDLRTVANGADISLTLNGTMNQLKTEVRSTSPDVTDEEARRALYGNLGTEDAATLLSAELLGVTGRAVGLDTLRIERGMESTDFRNDPTLIVEEFNNDQSTRLTLAKRVRPDLEIIVSRSLQESGGIAAAISYNIRRNIELRVSQRENTDRAIAIRHEISFGGGRGSRRSNAAPQPEISAVRITGEPGRSEAELLDLVKLKEGDRFAFHEWQGDVDRLKESYTKLGYYETRVRPSRQAAEDGQSVELDYRIDQGPKTTLSIQGHEAHQGLIDELQDAWSRAIFDRFLIDDVRWRVQQDLLSEGYFGGKVEPTIVRPNPQTKELRVTIEPGTRVSGREIRFQGNTAFSRGRLESALSEQGIGDEAWFDPWRPATALSAFYQEQGYLGVNITPSDPKVEGSKAVLLLTIEEGRQFTFAKPAIHGSAEARRMLLERILGFTLNEGTPYDALSVQRARERIEGFYLRRGFNSARVESRSTSDQAAAMVSVAFTVEEGPQQVLREVTTEGGERTRPGVVQGNLRLPVGQPVDLGQWAQARKRMYDTNVFAQVDIEPVPMTPTEEDKAAGIEPVRAVVRLTEYPVWRLRYGLQVNDVRTGDEDPTVPDSSRQLNLGMLTDIQNRNIFGRAIAGGLAARVERDRQIGTLFASNGSFFRLPIRSQMFFFTARERDREPIDLNYDRVGVTFEQRWQALRRTEVVYGYRYDQTRTYEREPDPNPLVPPLDVTNHTGKLTAGVIFDRRNDPFNATGGWFTAANYEWAARMLGGDSRNAKMLVQQYYFLRVGDIVFASRAQIGSAFGKDPLPSNNAFELGGATTVRGYAEDGLGPKNIVGQSQGQALLLLNQEVRFPVMGWVKAVGFVDAGNTYATRGDLSFSDLKVGYGVGIRLDTPFAMFRVDFGVPGSTLPGSARRANSLGDGRWYIGIGHIF